ncbi:Flp pilus assembly protein CpaB [Prosthecodimorpha staleyi]|uniref:Flp pilus assembly protein CpaB n=1 Tax=Prosthecodimorpha staleyi TaxID=2840188 RepID=A0A947D6K4_9HYPH|nr:Flp pilus assembly protein CpaB [Prosthecodimorpha staleyi]MBT9291278.1 Flp pilus assembly protein CpaB [Prosthecodimorpha staleyi]
MKVARLLVLTVAIGAGLAAAMVATSMIGTNEAPPSTPVADAPAPRMDTVEVLVLGRDIPMGGKVAAADLIWQPWPKSGMSEAYIAKANRPNATLELVGTIARQPIAAGEPVREGRLIKSDRGYMSVILSPGMRALAVEVKAVSTAGGFVLPNDHVDIILTRAAPKTAGSSGGDPFVSETLLTNIRVLAIDQQVIEKGEPAVVARDTATLELTPRQVEIVAQAQQLGTISLVLRSIRDADVPIADDGNRNEATSAVRVVRYGVTSRVTTR